MNTLIVLFSKTGNTRGVADKVIEALGCECTELTYDEKNKKTEGGLDPSGFERVILMCPIWAFTLPEPIKHYLKEHGKSIQSYSLVVTYRLLGLRGCISNCVKYIGKQPMKAMKIKAEDAKTGNYDIKSIL